MAILPRASSSLDLTISISGFSSSPSSLPSSSAVGAFAMKDLDINQVPSEEGGGGEEDELNATTGSMEDEEDISNGGGGGPPRKKLRLSKEQSRLLEECFRHNHTLNPVH